MLKDIGRINLVRTKKVGSVRSKREVEALFRESFEGTKKTIKAINQKLDEGKPLTDEEIRF